MALSKIARAMKRGKCWAEEQVKAGKNITPDSIEQAAMETYDHLGYRYLFMTSALEVVLETTPNETSTAAQA